MGGITSTKIINSLTPDTPSWQRLKPWTHVWYEAKMHAIRVALWHHRQQLCSQSVNLLWRSDAMWRHVSGTTLAQVMACCLAAQRNYLNQCWFIISQIPWHSSEGNFKRDTPVINHQISLTITTKISFIYLRGQCENEQNVCPHAHAMPARTNLLPDPIWQVPSLWILNWALSLGLHFFTF